MRRMHLFEWEDQPWLPTVFRDFITDHLRYSLNEPMRRPVNVAIAKRLKALLDDVRANQIVDLCSGAGGPCADIFRILVDELDSRVQIVLTDLHPNLAAFERLHAETAGRIRARHQPTNALNVPADLPGVRTVFTSFHHFGPNAARLMLADAVRRQTAIAIFEPLVRTARVIALVGLLSFVRGFTVTPRLGRLTPSRFLLTYLLPVAPLIFAWDGMVSALRTYTPEELLELADGLGGSDYRWESGRFDVEGPYGAMPTTYLIGSPNRSESAIAGHR